MAMSNIEQFNFVTGQVLATLYEHFPKPIELNAEVIDVSIPEWKQCERSGEMAATSVHPAEEVFFYHTVHWLAEAGYLAYKNTFFNYQFYGARLTPKGLEVLKAVPESLNQGQSFGESLMKASKDGSKELLKGVVSEALGIGARMLSTHFGLPGG
ncbi:hypothetical protein MRR18_31650 [Pseudomonas aeruginosa]|uniref:hypothetical protein n=1 Tax=Pseudomonas aeruginosa TaxID=287 RepID=UPI001CA52BD7|nr:hypothetical protein [Pseudomonas aeruginosa]MBW5452606.1 hypothetical protein [Pseudomonas aeruginosa]MDT8714943.1 hypothetical protein [Pseudomonas aeruginosa]MDT8736277.1 hypothetical protein [Pseudomonas aeruginosa]HBO6794638.1 hypothetical protein [Pseudomonas aeruginosa]HBO7320169.1 hypothetical protein [Pseudomonas aeruginosa]